MSVRIYGNRQLKTLSGQGTRPTSARVREALFNIWQGRIANCCWLDLCSGSGAMGAEALCRGAKNVIGIDKSGRACNIIKGNWKQVAQPEQGFQVMQGDVVLKLKALVKQKFDFIYFDPPYSSNLYEPVLGTITKYELLTSNGEMAVEHNPKLWPATSIGDLVIHRQKTYGKTNLTFYKLKEPLNEQ